jgi:hypothetical protein
MRYTLLFLFTLLVLTFTACSYTTEFVVVNESDQPVEVRYKIKRFPNEPPNLNAQPAKMDAAQLGSHDRQQWRRLNYYEYQVDQENRTITVVVMSHEALWVTNMFHYFGDEDPNDVASWPIEEISVTGADGGMMFTGQKARKSFSYVSRVLYTLTYK